MRFAVVKCKFCGGPARAQWEDGDIQEAIDRFIHMLACNRCADAYRARNDSGSEIVSKCFGLARTREKDRGRIIADTRAALLLLTRAYAGAMATILNAPTVLWDEAFADRLIEHPDKATEILKRYRGEVRKNARGNVEEVAA